MALFHKVRFNKIVQYTKFGFQLRSCFSSTEKKGLVLGVYSKGEKGDIILTSVSEDYNKVTKGKLTEALKLSGNNVKKGKSYLYWGLDPTYNSVTVVGLGDVNQGYNELEELDEKKEAIRIASNVGYKNLKQAGMNNIVFDDMCDAESAAEGAVLSSWLFNAYRQKKEDDSIPPCITLYPNSSNTKEWKRGIVKATAQNIARNLMETPANLMTPTIFANYAKELLTPNGVKVEIRDETWAQNKKMGGFLSVTRGSEEPAKFLEMTYCGKGNDKPIVFVGKGVTFDSGGISLKPSLNMDGMRADMGGAASVVGTIYAVSCLQLPVNLVGLVPLCENMPSGIATKPGDVITTMSGKTVCVDNTDAEGRMILADALTYSQEFNPKFVLDIATLTGAMIIAVGDSATGVFTNSVKLWEELRKAGSFTGDRVWRFPLWKHYTDLVTKYTAYDVNNVGKGKGGGSCTAAAFLREFAPKNTDWMHLDMASVMGPDDHTTYLSRGMKGRPVRTLVQFIDQLSK